MTRTTTLVPFLPLSPTIVVILGFILTMPFAHAQQTAISTPGSIAAREKGASIQTNVDRILFPLVEIGNSLVKRFIVTNVGGAHLQGEATIDSPFEIAGVSTYSLAPGESETITIRFSPQESGLCGERAQLSGGEGATVLVFGDGTPAVASLSGYIFSTVDGSPIPNATIDMASGAQLMSFSSANGEFFIPRLSQGGNSFAFFAPGFDYAYPIIQVLDNTPQTMDIFLTPLASDPPDITGHLSDPFGSPLGGALAIGYVGFQEFDSQWTNADGYYELRNADLDREGEREVCFIYFFALDGACHPFSVNGGLPIEIDATLEIERGTTTVSGAITDSLTGAPIANAEVLIECPTERFGARTYSDSEGLFTLSSVPADAFATLRIFHERYDSWHELFQLEPDELTTLAIQMESGSGAGCYGAGAANRGRNFPLEWFVSMLTPCIVLFLTKSRRRSTPG